MNRVGILATLQARPGKEINVEEFLKSATPLVERKWARPLGSLSRLARRRLASSIPSTTNRGEDAHVNGEVAKALFARAEELFVTPPQIQMLDIVAEKL